MQNRGGGCGRIAIAAIVAIISLVTYFSQRQYNPITRETQHVAMSVRQEIALGLQSAPQMAAQYGGESGDATSNRRVDEIGQRIVSRSPAARSDYQFEFTLLADGKTINAFALPGGQIFITEGLYRQLDTAGQVAGVLGHEIGHVVARHGAEHLARAQLQQGLTGAAVIASYDPDNPASRRSAQVAMLMGQLLTMRYGRDDELESDRIGVEYVSKAGYDPRAMIRVMQVLAAAGGGRGTPEFFSTHPNPDNRVKRIEEAIAKVYPNGVPRGLEP